MDDGVLYRRQLSGGRVLDVLPLLFGRASLCLGPADACWYADVWHYDARDTALRSAATWDGVGEPPGWSRHPRSGRRRPHGDASQEYLLR